MLNEIISDIEFFKIYHSGSKVLTGNITRGPGNDMIALAIGGIILLIVVGLIIYIRKKYKQKYSFWTKLNN